MQKYEGNHSREGVFMCDKTHVDLSSLLQI